MLGAVALLVAGVGAVIVSSSTASSAEARSSYAPLSSEFSGSDVAGYARSGDLPQISRAADRGLLEQQAELQAQQRLKALTQLTAKTQAHAKQLASNQWVLPVTGYVLTARFGEISGLWSTVHTGLDFAAPAGTPIVAVAHGVVTYASYDGSYGNKVIERLDDGTTIWYCHQTSYVVHVGQTLDPGELLGYVGSTGNTTGAHLHLEVHPGGGAPVDPFAALVAHGVHP